MLRLLRTGRSPPRVIKYLGAKTRLRSVLGDLFRASGANTAIDLFSGTTLVAQTMKRQGIGVTAVDTARYSELFGQTYITLDRDVVDRRELADAIGHLGSLEGEPGWFTDTYCETARFFHPDNGKRIDSIRETIATDYADIWMYPVLMTALIEAADRVDSTLGFHVSYLKQWAPRALQPMVLRSPGFIAGTGTTVRADSTWPARFGQFDLAYIDPPYNQHRYYSYYHIWETLVAWDRPGTYGVAQKRADNKTGAAKTELSSKRTYHAALERALMVDAEIVVVSYNDESWTSLDHLVVACGHHEHVAVIGFETSRHVGAKLGVNGPDGTIVGEVGRTENVEFLVVAGPKIVVERMTGPYAELGPIPKLGGQHTMF